MTAAIPIENIYYLLSYAWDVLPEAEFVQTSLTPEMRLQDLLGRLLHNSMSHIMRRGLDRSYLSRTEELAGIRGRLDLDNSLKRATLPRARAICVFDELSPDVRHNQIIKATLRRLAAYEDLDNRLSEDLRELYRRMPDVADTAIRAGDFRRVNLGRHNAGYRFPLMLCEIILRNLLVHERTGDVEFRDFTRDDAQMRRLFEKFLLRFFDREQNYFRVRAQRFPWRARGKAADLARLPMMQTDMVLTGDERTIVIDAKYYAETLTEYFSRSTVRSSHLYQLFAYMRHVEARLPKVPVSGMLIYPRTTESVRISVDLFGHPLTVATINLAQPWHGVRCDLLALLSNSDARAVEDAHWLDDYAPVA